MYVHRIVKVKIFTFDLTQRFITLQSQGFLRTSIIRTNLKRPTISSFLALSLEICGGEKSIIELQIAINQ